MTDITNRVVKICRRLTEIEYQQACGDQSDSYYADLNDEYESLSAELSTLQPAVGMPDE
jgi:hypothetical protein